MARGKGVALVTGAAGFTGWHMVKLLLEEGYEIIATDCRKSNNDPVYKLTRFIEIDLTNPADVFDEGFLKELAEAQFVFHIAGIFDHAASLSKLFEVNVLGTRNLLDAIRRAHAGEAQKYPRVIIWGASGIFGDFSHISLPATEAMPPRTDNPYFLSKLYEELEALRFWQRDRLPVTVLRPSAVYGSHSVYGMALSITTLLKSRMAFVVGNGKNKGVLVHVRDVVRAAEFLARNDGAVGEVYHVTDDNPYSVEEITRSLAQSCGAIFVPIKIPTWIALRLAKLIGVHRELIKVATVNTWLSNEKLKKLGFSFQYPDSKIGLAETAAWYKRMHKSKR